MDDFHRHASRSQQATESKAKKCKLCGRAPAADLFTSRRERRDDAHHNLMEKDLSVKLPDIYLPRLHLGECGNPIGQVDRHTYVTR
jgi:hypothetical protein